LQIWQTAFIARISITDICRAGSHSIIRYSDMRPAPLWVLCLTDECYRTLASLDLPDLIHVGSKIRSG